MSPRATARLLVTVGLVLLLPFAMAACSSAPKRADDSAPGAAGDAPRGAPAPGSSGTVPCGAKTCPAGQVCCNPSCGICTPPDGFCTQQFCDPPAAGGAGGGGGGAGACRVDADCRAFSDYCTGCDCRALGRGDPDPTCPGPGVRCLVDPCRDKAAACDRGRCTLRARAM